MAKSKNISRDINLLPAEYREKEKYNLPRLFFTIFIILLLAASTYLYFYLENNIYYRENEVKNLETQLAEIEKVIEEVKNLESDKAELLKRVEVIENIIINQSRFTRVLGAFSEATLAEVWLNNLNINANQTFDITAHTFNNYLVAQYMNTLKDSVRFDSIELHYIRKENTKFPELDQDIDTVNFQLSGVYIPFRQNYE